MGVLCTIWEIIGEYLLEPLYELAGFLSLIPVQNAIEDLFFIVLEGLSCVT